ncbi:NifU family protein [Flavobacterium arcticum]|uniref:NifU family protein n=1 Tax=Flavobacterium arcticum TaxID=1784713 RepID=A0A345HC45_9FLAO|nr:NifU family protein [Flavobacterium arcticum]AXG74155.1 NifU family protein [Flavobacterium arcticum]KAF2507286.1 NifU family protein [Flavobacterium arcticum]
MEKINIKPTQNADIMKFEFSNFIAKGNNFEYKNIDETANSPLAKQLFYLPFVKSVYISGNFIGIEKYSIVEWGDVQEDVAQQIEDFVNNGGIIITEDTAAKKKLPVTIYVESTPNPAVMKFVYNKLLTKVPAEFKNIDETAASPLARELFKLPFVKEVFFDENYISITKYDVAEWEEITAETRSFIKTFIEEGNVAIDESLIQKTPEAEKQEEAYFDALDVTSQRIINILEEYVKPAVAGDGGNIAFDSYDEKEKRVKVILQGACSGCPSSTFTLKSGIENMLKDMLNDNDIQVEALNA